MMVKMMMMIMEAPEKKKNGVYQNKKKLRAD